MNKEKVKEIVAVKKELCMKDVDKYIVSYIEKERGIKIGDKVICLYPSEVVEEFIFKGVENEYILGEKKNGKIFNKVWWYLIDYMKKEDSVWTTKEN